MTIQTPLAAAIDRLYGEVPPAEWAQILGSQLHYHFGFFADNEDLETGVQATVRRFFPFIANGARVLDAGCGWGGPARLLADEKSCVVTCITISHVQAEHCRSLGLTTEVADLETAELSGPFDVAFLCESLDHVHDKAGLLRRLRQAAGRLVIRTNAVSSEAEGEACRGCSPMLLDLCTPRQLEVLVREAGWQIVLQEERRKESMRTFWLWKQNLDRVYGERPPPGQLFLLQQVCTAAVNDPVRFAREFPLVDIVAE